MVFHVTAALAHDVLKLALHVVKRIAQGNIPIFVLDPVHRQLMAWQRVVDSHPKRARLMLVLLLLVNGDSARLDVRRK